MLSVPKHLSLRTTETHLPIGGQGFFTSFRMTCVSRVTSKPATTGHLFPKRHKSKCQIRTPPDHRVGCSWSADGSGLGGTSGHVEHGKRVLPNPDGSVNGLPLCAEMAREVGQQVAMPLG